MTLSERKNIAVAFGDIHGFKSWIRKGTNPPDVRDPFLACFYKEVQSFLRRHPSIYAKYLGDGFMLVRELPTHGHYCYVTIAFIKELQMVTRQINDLIKRCSVPPPPGFRMRLACGYVTKFELEDPNDRDRKISEYVGYICNLAEKLLHVSPDIPFLVHRSVVKILGEKRKNFKSKPHHHSKERVPGIDLEDIEGLWIFPV